MHEIVNRGIQVLVPPDASGRNHDQGGMAAPTRCADRPRRRALSKTPGHDRARLRDTKFNRDRFLRRGRAAARSGRSPRLTTSASSTATGPPSPSGEGGYPGTRPGQKRPASGSSRRSRIARITQRPLAEAVAGIPAKLSFHAWGQTGLAVELSKRVAFLGIAPRAEPPEFRLEKAQRGPFSRSPAESSHVKTQRAWSATPICMKRPCAEPVQAPG